MESNEVLRKAVMTTIANQMRANDPPETKRTYTRLIGEGYSAQEAKELIASCLIIEIFGALKHQEPFDENRYTKNLKHLPKEPSDDK